MGEKIKKRREELGISQAELAEMTGISRVQISNYERGACKGATWQNLRKLAAALKVKPNYFFD